MPLHINDVPNCCTAKLIYGFGGSGTVNHDRMEPKETTAKQLKDLMEQATRDGNGILTAYVTTRQTQAIEILESMGWTLSSESEKGRHTETKLRCYNYTCRQEKEVKKVVNPFAPAPKVGQVVYNLRDLPGCFGQRFNSARASAIFRQITPTGDLAVGLKYAEEYQQPPKGKWLAVRNPRDYQGLVRGVTYSVILEHQMGSFGVVRGKLSGFSRQGHQVWKSDMTPKFIYIHP